MIGEKLWTQKGKAHAVIEIGDTPEGTRYDIPVTWQVEGPKIKGKIETVDYFNLRTDNTGEVNARGILFSEEGEKIEIRHNGYAMPTSNADVRRVKTYATFRTSSKRYAYINSTIAVLEGTYDGKNGEIELTAYEWK